MTTPEHQGRITEIAANLQELVTKEIELAKAEMAPSVRHAARGGGLLGAAVTFALHAAWMLIIAVALFFGWLYDSYTALGTWAAFIWGFVTAAALSLIIAGILAALGRSRIRKVKKPEATIAEFKATVELLTAGRSKRSAISAHAPAAKTVATPSKRSS